MPKKVLITGAGGFIGRHLAAKLLSLGFEVHGIDRVDPGIKGMAFDGADILDKEKIKAAVEGKDIVIHLAAITAHQDIVDNPCQTLELNLMGVYNLLEAFEQSSASQFIFPSTGKVYGKPYYLPYDEKHPVNPETILGKSKLISESLIDFFAFSSQKSFVVFRIFNVYGQLQKSSFLVPTIISQLDSAEIVLGDIKSKRDYIYISDVVDAFVAAITNPQKGLELYNVGTGISYSAEEIAEELKSMTGSDAQIAVNPDKLRKGEYAEERADSSKLQALGWKPSVSLNQGLRKVLAK